MAAAEPPDLLTLSHHRDLKGRERRPLSRWVLLSVLGAIVALGAVNAFGQQPQTTMVEAPGASLKVYSPSRLRSGLFYESRFTIEAREEIENATLVLDPGWLEGMTLNTVEPTPIGEASRNGRIAFELGRVPAGNRHIFFLHFQVNPTNVGHRSADVELHDGETLLARIDRSVTVFP